MSSRRRSLTLVWLAAAVGLVHAAASVYWAAGGRWLLASVGQWAVDLTTNAPDSAAAVLGVVALVKVLAALIPVAVAHARMPWPRWWRAISWVGGSFLVLYGGLNIVVSAAVLTGIVRPDGGYDPVAMKGHAFLWDPLFFLWGLFLVGSLWWSRPAVDQPRPVQP